ncbi:MAG TPA: hypothetical protein DCL60_10725 [Armatimonadetes bacterium]|nr:hypothetical protein [Armatimonadota bacterium]
MADLFQTERSVITKHIRNIFDSGELDLNSVCAKIAHTATDGKTYQTQHYNLDMIISVGYRVNSLRGTQFRIWATQRLKEYIVKGFTLDDERLMETGRQPDYFDELLERVRAIRASEKRFYQKVTDIYKTSIDYDPEAELTKTFFATVQNKFHYAVTGHTAAEIIAGRADAKKPNMGLTTWKGTRVRKCDVTVAKNYLSEPELRSLNLIVDQYLSFAEFQAEQRRAMHMSDWVRKLDDFLKLNERDILRNAGKISKDIAAQIAENHFETFQAEQRALEARAADEEFDNSIKQLRSHRKQ